MNNKRDHSKETKLRAKRAETIGSRTWLNNKRNSLRSRGARKGLLCDLSVDDMATLFKNVDKPCPYCGLQMIFGDKFRKPSVDRVLPDKGYTLNNCLVVCLACNFLKTNLNEKQIFAIYTHMKKVRRSTV